jgi:hypothetical protein
LSTSGPSNNWELQTREILRNALPEYDIDPHMRLSNVVKGRIAATQQMAMYEVDFCVREKATGFVVCAIELDGWQHKTENGQRKDGNKNLWLAQAKIQLIRITHPNQAINIRQLIEQKNQQKEQEEFVRFTPVNNHDFGAAKNAIAAVIVTVVGVWIFIGLMNGLGHQLSKTISQPITAIQKQNALNQAEAQQKQAQIQAAEQQRLAQIAAVQYQAKIEEQRVIAHKESFEKNYQKPAGCDNPKDMGMMIECSNHYMREKKKFNVANGYQ